MDLRIFFDIVELPFQAGIYEPNTWISHIEVYVEKFPNWKDADIALIGLSEDRGTVTNKGLEKGPDEVRNKLYRLKKGTGAYNIVDLGNLRRGISLEETQLRLKEVCESLLQNNTIPIIIGGSHDMDYGQVLAYESSGKLVNFLNVDACIDLYGTEELGQSKNHIHKILLHQPNLIFHYCQLGYQTYLTDNETLSTLEKLHFETYRVGQIRDNLENIEPIIRNADLMSFDISAIKHSDAPGNKDAQPFGLTGEEACQICWYAGLNNKMSSVGFYEYNPEEDYKGHTAAVIATMIWYFTEGFYLRRDEKSMSDPVYMKYTVSLKEEPHQLVFYKNTKSEKWWMEVPYPADKARLARNSVVPCSYSDYVAANQGEIPIRWILTHAKLI